MIVSCPTGLIIEMIDLDFRNFISVCSCYMDIVERSILVGDSEREMIMNFTCKVVNCGMYTNVGDDESLMIDFESLVVEDVMVITQKIIDGVSRGSEELKLYKKLSKLYRDDKETAYILYDRCLMDKEIDLLPRQYTQLWRFGITESDSSILEWKKALILKIFKIDNFQLKIIETEEGNVCCN